MRVSLPYCFYKSCTHYHIAQPVGQTYQYVFNLFQYSIKMTGYKNQLFYLLCLQKFLQMKDLILEAWGNRELLKDVKYADAVRAVIEEVDKGRLRTASPVDPSGAQGGWQVNEWVKQAILMYFGI